MLYTLSPANPNSRQSLCDEITDKSHHTKVAIVGINVISKGYLVYRLVGYLVEFEDKYLESELLINIYKELVIKS